MEGLENGSLGEVACCFVFYRRLIELIHRCYTMQWCLWLCTRGIVRIVMHYSQCIYRCVRVPPIDAICHFWGVKSSVVLCSQQVEWTDNHQQRTLHVRLTEEADPFFLYQLTISEEDFQGKVSPPRATSRLESDPARSALSRPRSTAHRAVPARGLRHIPRQSDRAP